MLFDLRGRGRRRTVQGVYLGLAILMGGGLILFGVGTGVGGDPLTAIFGGGSSNQNQVVSQAEKTALRETRLSPNSPQSWYDLTQARWDQAKQGANYNANTGTFTTAGRKQLTLTTQAWQRYLQLTKKPDPGLAELAARAYAALGDYASATNARELQSAQDPTASAYECLAATAYAAKQTHKGDLATAKALSMLAKVQQLQIKQQLTQAKAQPQAAQQIVAQSC